MSSAAEPASKRSKAFKVGSRAESLPDCGPDDDPAASQVIGTHSGPFHADEALAVYLLRKTAEYRDADIVRTRDAAKRACLQGRLRPGADGHVSSLPVLVAPLDIVVDVGGVYDHAAKRYDHHQRGFDEVFGRGMDGEHTTKLSSAGLVYKWVLGVSACCVQDRPGRNHQALWQGGHWQRVRAPRRG